MHHLQDRTARRHTHPACLPETPRPRLGLCVTAAVLLAMLVCAAAGAQETLTPAEHAAAAKHRAAQFLRGRTSTANGTTPPAEALAQARAQHLAMQSEAGPLPRAGSASARWTPVGPLQVQTAAYGRVTGRVTSVAIDPNDTTGNTVYAGTSGGGVWKSTNAAGSAASVVFSPLTDTLSAFSPNAGTSAIPSLSIGAISVQPGGTGVILAGTGDPNDATDSYYGSGLLRSADHGSTWSLITNPNGGGFTGEAFAGFAWSTASPQLVVAAVSTSTESGTVQHVQGQNASGLYYSQDGGAHWTAASLKDGDTIIQYLYTDFSTFHGNAATSVVWNPVRQKFYAAVRFHGYYESPDGINFTRMANQPGAGLTAANCPTRPNTSGLASCAIVRGALAAQPVSGDLFALTVDTVNNDQGLWQDTCNQSNGACASATVQWGTQINAAPMESSGTIPQGDYNLALAAVPAATALSMTDTLLFAGTADLYRCGLYGGCSLRNTTNTNDGCAAPAGVAPAQHAIAWQANPSNSAAPVMYFGNDGGLWRSLDGVRQQQAVCSPDDAAHFDNLNSALGSLAEISGFSSHPSDPNTLLAALGANGSAASTTAAQASSAAPWTQLSAGESGTVAIDQSNGQTWLLQSGAGVALHACTRGSACGTNDFAGPAAIGSAQVQGDESQADPPALLDPNLNTNAVVGTCRVFRGPVSGGSTWSASNAISRFLAGPSAPACNSSDASIRSLAAGGPAVQANGAQNSGSSVLYAGLAGLADGGSTYGGHLYATTLGATAASSTAWTDTSLNPVSNDPNGFNQGGFDISSVAVDPSDATGKTVYATIMGFGYPHVYRSTDGGNTWLNISANLPNAPANGVAVDPNNPLVVYVAMDTGVYATADVTTCVPAQTGTTSSCWGVFGTALPNAPMLSLVASRTTGLLRAGSYGRGIWQIPLLTAGQTVQPAVTFSPGSLTFTTEAVGTTSAAQTVTLTNTGNAALKISAVSASNGFAETDTCANTSLTVNQSCTLSVTFSPSTPGTANGTVAVYANVGGGYASLPLSGTGQGTPSLVLAPGTLSFPTTTVGSTSASQSVTLRNTGTGAATLSTPTSSADFNIAGTTCGSTLNPGSSCTLSISFSPSQNATELGTASISDGTTMYTVSLNGAGTGSFAVTVSPASIDFGNRVVNNTLGQTITVQTVTVQNGGNVAATLGAPVLTGDFGVYHNGCTAALAPGQSCTIDLFFVPTAVGPRSGTFTLSDGRFNHTVTLTGLGTSADITFSPASLDFGTVNVGSSSSAQTVTVTYIGTPGSSPIVWGVLSPSADFSVPSGSNTCVGLMGPPFTCHFSVVYTPTVDGPRSGYITLTESLHTAAHIVMLTGNGHGTPSVAVAPAALSFGTIAVNSTSAAQTVTVSNNGSAALGLGSATITGDYFIAASSCGTALASGATCTVSVDFTPHATGTRTGTLTVTDANGPHLISLTGNGIGAPIVTLAPGLLAFGQVGVGTTSASQTVTVSNGGTDTATLSAASITGDFAIAANTCGTTLAANSACSISITFTPAVSGNRTGVLSLPDTQGNHTANLTGSGVTGALTVNPASIAFPDTVSGSTSATRVVTVTNTGNGPLAIASVTITGDFNVTGNCAGTTLAAGYTCLLNLTFSPTATGARGGTLTVTGTATGPVTATVNLSGNGTGAYSVVLTPTALDFGTQLVGTASAVRNITISNTGTLAGSLGTVSVSGDFTLAANTCGTSLPPQTGCTVSIAFAPTASGIRNGTLSVSSGAGTQTATLTGAGTTGATDTLSALSLTFPSQQVNTTSGLQTVTLTNSGDTALTLITAQVLTGDFTASNGCGPTLIAHSTCSITVAFVPKSVGTQTGTLQITDVQRAQTVTLTGTATAGPGVTFLPSSLAFASTGVGVAGAAQSLTLTNNGGTPLTITAVTVIGDYGIVAGTGTCAAFATIPVAGSCTLGIAFLPTGAGQRTGSVVVTSNAPTQTAQLNGTGVDFQLVPNGNTSVTTSNGNNAVFPLLLRPLVTTTDPVTYTCTGAPANSTCKITSQYSDLSAISTVSVTVLTGVKTAARPGTPTSSARPANRIATCLLLPTLACIPWYVRRRTGSKGHCRSRNTDRTSPARSGSRIHIPSLFALLLACLATAALLGCGADKTSAVSGTGTGSGSGTGTGTGSTATTPTGTYTITASATAAGVTHSVPLTLTVQ